MSTTWLIPRRQALAQLPKGGDEYFPEKALQPSHTKSDDVIDQRQLAAGARIISVCFHFSCEGLSVGTSGCTRCRGLITLHFLLDREVQGH